MAGVEVSTLDDAIMGDADSTDKPIILYVSDVESSQDDADIMRPITLYVSKVNLENLSMNHIERHRITVIDIEMGSNDARKLAEHISRRVADHTNIGAIRVRLHGNLVL